jgi:hypothetical protein
MRCTSTAARLAAAMLGLLILPGVVAEPAAAAPGAGKQALVQRRHVSARQKLVQRQTQQRRAVLRRQERQRERSAGASTEQRRRLYQRQTEQRRRLYQRQTGQRRRLYQRQAQQRRHGRTRRRAENPGAIRARLEQRAHHWRVTWH